MEIVFSSSLDYYQHVTRIPESSKDDEEVANDVIEATYRHAEK